MKKIIIYLIIGAILMTNFAKAQFGLPGDRVPVFDPSALQALIQIIDTLNTNLTIIGDELKRLNLSTEQLLKTQFQQIASNINVDSSKMQQYIRNLVEIETLINIRKDKANSIDEYQKAIEEAKKAGAYLGLQEFAQKIDCLNPEIRDELTAYLMEITGEYNLSLYAEEILNSIPDCPFKGIVQETTVSLRPKFFSWLFEPFRLNLAQILPVSPGEEIPPIIITSAQPEFENSVELENYKLSALLTIQSFVSQKVEERRREIGTIWPLENCIQRVPINKNIDGGSFLCLDYETINSGDDMENLKKELSSNNPLNNTSQDINVFQVLTKPEIILRQIGANTSTNTSTDFAGTFTSEEEIKKIIDRTCANYKQEAGEQGTTLSTAYALCFKMFEEQLKKLVDILKNEIEKRKKLLEENQKSIENAKNDAENLQSQIDPNVCPGAYEDLENIKQELIGKILFYTGVGNQLSRIIINELNPLTSQINTLSSQVDGLLSEILAQPAEILNIVNEVLSTLKNVFEQIFGFNISTELKMVNEVKRKLDDIRKEVLNKVNEIVGQFDKIVNNISKVILRYNQTSFDLYRSQVTNASLLNDLHELGVILQRLEAYKRAVEKGECTSTESTPPSVSFIKNQVIVVKSKKEPNKPLNFFALLKNLFKPKIVEIRNEK
jgi:hypothetical protein